MLSVIAITTILPLLVAGLPGTPVKRASCTFTDAATAVSSKAACATITLSNLNVPSGGLDMTGLTKGTVVIFEGKTVFQKYADNNGYLLKFSGDSITIQGASGHSLDGQGPMYWDGKGSNGGSAKPKFFSAHSLTNSVIEDLNIINTPVQAFSIDSCQNLRLNGIQIDDRNGGDDSLAHNTDAFNIGSSTGVYIDSAKIYNQDDCIAVNSGTDISFSNGLCSGGHGLSIGSVGGRSDNTVENVVISDSSIQDSLNGVRIKVVAGASSGSVKNVTYSGITLSGITGYGIAIDQDYSNSNGFTGSPTAGIPITGLTLNGVTGTVASGGTDVRIVCAAGACSGWTWKGISVSGGKTDPASCQNIPSGASC